MLLVETIPLSLGGDNIYEIETPQNYPSPYKKNKVNHINKIIMTKLSLMHPRLFSKRVNFAPRIKFSWPIAIDLQRIVLFIIKIFYFSLSFL